MDLFTKILLSHELQEQVKKETRKHPVTYQSHYDEPCFSVDIEHNGKFFSGPLFALRSDRTLYLIKKGDHECDVDEARATLSKALGLSI